MESEGGERGIFAFSSVIVFSYKVNNFSSMMDMSVLASTSPQSLCLPSGHANMVQIIPVCRGHCWRRPSRKPFVFRRVTPTWSGFFRLAGAIVGADLPANPLSSIGARQHGVDFSDLLASLLASTSPQTLCLPLGHANTVQIIPVCRGHCWHRPPRKSFVFRRVTPTRFGLS